MLVGLTNRSALALTLIVPKISSWLPSRSEVFDSSVDVDCRAAVDLPMRGGGSVGVGDIELTAMQIDRTVEAFVGQGEIDVEVEKCAVADGYRRWSQNRCHRR